MDLKITAVVAHLPLNTMCDHTGKLKSQEELKRQGNSPYRGKIRMAIWAGQRKLISFDVIVLEGKSELYCKLEQTQGLNGLKNAFELDSEIEEQASKLALRVLRTGLPQDVEL